MKSFAIIFCSMIITLMCAAEPVKYQKQPLVFTHWPMTSRVASVRGKPLSAGGLALNIKSASNNVPFRIQPSQMILKSPSQLANDRIKATLLRSPSMHLYLKSNPNYVPNSKPLKSTAIRFQTPPPPPSLPATNKIKHSDFIYEKVNVPKFTDAIKIIGNQDAIHTIPAPNLSSSGVKTSVSYSTIHNSNNNHNNFVNDNSNENLKKFHSQLTTNTRGHQYQVKEEFLENLNGKTSLHVPEVNAPGSFKYKTFTDHSWSDSNGNQVYPYTVESAPLIATQSYSVPVPVPVAPQLQQHVSQQSSMLDFYNPTYLVMQSNNLYSQHQQHLNKLFQPEITYDNSINQFSTQKPELTAASLGQIYSATQDQLNELTNLQLQAQQYQQQFETTPSTTTAITSSYLVPNLPLQESSSETSPVYAQLVDTNNNYYQQSNDDLTNQLAYQEYLTQQRQLDNEKILQQAQEEAYYKQQRLEQQEKSAQELHQEALKEQFKSNPLRIIVPDYQENVNVNIQRKSDDDFYDDYYDEKADDETLKGREEKADDETLKGREEKEDSDKETNHKNHNYNDFNSKEQNEH